MKVHPFRRRRKDRKSLGVRTPIEQPSKDTAACCRARRDDLGRPPIGFCSPTCERRIARNQLLRSS